MASPENEHSQNSHAWMLGPLPPRAGWPVLEHDPLRREVVADPVRLGEVPPLARGQARLDLGLDLGGQDLDRAGRMPRTPSAARRIAPAMAAPSASRVWSSIAAFNSRRYGKSVPSASEVLRSSSMAAMKSSANFSARAAAGNAPGFFVPDAATSSRRTAAERMRPTAVAAPASASNVKLSFVR